MSRVSARYAKALIDLSNERGELEKVHGDIQAFMEVAKNREFANMLQSPVITSDKKASIFKAVFGDKISATTTAFFDIIMRKGRESSLVSIANAFVEQYKTLKNITTIKLTTATVATDEMIATIKGKLEKSGAIQGTVDLETAVDADIIGGFVLEFGDKLYDASIASQLNELKKEFSKNDYIKNI
jgi:F-type H+-transporting ATPase subunit delta